MEPVSNIVIGLITLAIALLGTLIVSVWRFSALATTLSLAVSNLKEDIREIRTSVESIKSIPVLEQRMTQIEKVVEALASVRPKSASHHDLEST